MKKWRMILVALTATLGGGVLQAEPALGPRLGDLRGRTVGVGGDAIPSERYAAEEFCRLFKAATGSELRTATTAADGGAVYIGTSPALRAHPLGFSIAELGEEGLRIRIDDRALLIAGGRPRGTL